VTNFEMQTVARLAAREAVEQTFLALGVDISTPKEIQSTQHDFAFLRSFRLTVRTLRTHALTVAVGLAVTGIGSAIWLAAKAGSAAAH
jgi:hypothetical protein